MKILLLFLKVIILSIILVSFFPSSSYSVIYLCIDPGHGGMDDGATGRVYGVKEKDANLWVGLALRDSLNNSGYPDSTVIPIMTRIIDTTITVSKRVDIAMGDNPDSAKASQFISIHHNSTEDEADTTTNGTETWWSSCWLTPEDSIRDDRPDLAEAVQGKMVETLNWPNRGIKDGYDTLAYVLHHTTMISALPEISFITCKTIDSLFYFDSTEYAKKEASPIYRGWCHYIGEDPIYVIRNYFDGGWVEVDGIPRWSPFHGAWFPQETHTIKALDQFWYDDYWFCEWSDNGWQEHDIIVGFMDEVITAYFSWNYYYYRVDQPWGGESYNVGDTMRIVMEGFGGIYDPPMFWGTYLNIFLSRDGGVSYQDTIAIDCPTDGESVTYYYWLVTEPGSNNCRIKIYAYDGLSWDPCNTYTNISNQFTIIGPSMELVSPNGGEEWQVSTNHNITWSSVSFSDSIKLEYSTDGGSNWIVIVDSTSNDGSYYWTIPNTPSNQCRVNISDSKDGDPYDISDNDFTISPGPLYTPSISSTMRSCDFPGDTAVVNLIIIDWNDNNDYEDGYEIWRKDATDEIWRIYDSTSENSTSFQDRDLVGSETYSYRIKAFNLGGTSDFSNIKTIKAKPNPARDFNSRIKWVCASGYGGFGSGGGGMQPNGICPKIPSNRVILSWNAPNPQKLPIEYYELWVNCCESECYIYDSTALTSIEVCVPINDNCFTQLTAIDSEGSESCVLQDNFSTFGCYQKCTPLCGGDDTPAKLISEALTPSEFSSSQNYPNPFNAITRIEFALPQAGKVKVEIFNILGKSVIELLNSEMHAGFHSVLWDGTDKMHNNVSSGVYLYRIEFGNSSDVRKMLLLK